MSQPLEVALFPIPSLVAFPGTIVPLHVFEPRYRQMINDCVRDQRMRIVKEIQLIPYRIVSSQPLHDDVPDPSEVMSIEGRNRDLQLLINSKLLVMIGAANPEFENLINGSEWQSLNPDEFSYQLFETLRFDPDMMQAILEACSTQARLNIIWDYLCR